MNPENCSLIDIHINRRTDIRFLYIFIATYGSLFDPPCIINKMYTVLQIRDILSLLELIVLESGFLGQYLAVMGHIPTPVDGVEISSSHHARASFRVFI